MNDIEVLIVEDNADEAKLAMRALSKNSITDKVMWLKNGEEAENFLFGKDQFSDRNISCLPKFILLDLKLPKVTGKELIQLLKKNDATRSIPIVVLSASKEDSDLKDCYDLGVNSYMVKPVDFQDFTTLIQRIGQYWLFHNESVS